MAAKLHLVAHRGYAAAYPENTALALEAAVRLGAAWIEFDVQLTADRVPVLLHDPTFDRTAGRPGCVMRMDYAEVECLDVGEPDRFGARFAGTPVSRLEDVVAMLANWPGVTAFVELKRHSLEHFGSGAVLDTVLPMLEPVADRVVVISFVEEVLRELRNRSELPVGWAIREWSDASHRTADELQPEYLFCNVTKLPAAPAALWQGLWEWVVYEITDPEIARQLGDRGVRLIETMAFAELQSALNRRQAAPR